MRTVLYTFEFEPITVIELKPWAEQYLLAHSRVRLPVMVAPTYEPSEVAHIVIEILV